MLDDRSIKFPVTIEGDEAIRMLRSLAESVEKLGRAVEILANQQYAVARHLAREAIERLEGADDGEV